MSTLEQVFLICTQQTPTHLLLDSGPLVKVLYSIYIPYMLNCFWENWQVPSAILLISDSIGYV